MSDHRIDHAGALDLNDLIVRYLEGRADEAEVSALNAELQTDAALRRRFVAVATNERCLCELLAAEPAHRAGRSGSHAHRAIVASPWRRAGLAIAAALVVAGVSAAVTLIVLVGRGEPGPEPIAAVDPTPVATLTDASDDLVWSTEPLNPGEEIARRTIRTESGHAELMLTSGAQVNVAGAAELRLDGPMQVAMNRGTATFTCPREARGFTVTLPGGARVVDLGTRFVVAVESPDRVVVQVLDGVIRYEAADGVPQLLTDDQAIAVVAGRSEPLSIRDARRPWRGPAYTYVYASHGIPPALESNRNDTQFTKLTDGKTGLPDVGDAQWIGFNDGISLTPEDNGQPQPAIDVTFADTASLRTLIVTYLVNAGSAIFPPDRIAVRYSDDGKTWSEPVEFTIGPAPGDATAELTRKDIRTAELPLGDVRTTHVRVEFYAAQQWVYLSEMSFDETPAGAATTPPPAPTTTEP